MSNFRLSKSTILRGKQCPKSLYLYKHEYDQRDAPEPEQQSKFSRGHKVGKLARQLFPGGIDVSPVTPFNYDQSVKATAYYVDRGQPVIYEASFKHHGVVVAVDILVKEEEGWHAYEVKSSVKLNSTYMFDAAIQYHVLTSSGLDLVNFSIVHIDADYVRQGELVLEELFVIRSVYNRIRKMQGKVEQNIASSIDIISLEKEPDIEIGPHCLKPYTCDYRTYCWDSPTDDSILYYSGLPMRLKFEQYRKGRRSIKELNVDDIPVGDKSRLRIKASQENRVIVQKDRIREFLDHFKGTLYFFDIEAMQSAVPIYEGNKPYQVVPFLFSLHKKTGEGKKEKIEHTYFISDPAKDERELWVQKFLEATEEEGEIFVFNTYLERRSLLKFSMEFPAYKRHLDDRIERLRDLEVPFKEVWYYHPRMQCSHSLKSVLPCLAPGFDYEDLKIRDGLEAMLAYQELVEDPGNFRSKNVLKSLVRYCERDTFALYQTYRALKRLLSE